MRQLSLFTAQKTFHGGDLVRGKRKTRRPFARNRPVHFVLKSRRHDLYHHYRAFLESELARFARRFHVRLYKVAVNHDHIHFIARTAGRKEYVAFIRSFTSLMARKLGKGIWRLLPFSRVLNWGRDYFRTKRYLAKNWAEASGTRSYEPRKDWYKRFRVSR